MKKHFRGLFTNITAIFGILFTNKKTAAGTVRGVALCTSCRHTGTHSSVAQRFLTVGGPAKNMYTRVTR